MAKRKSSSVEDFVPFKEPLLLRRDDPRAKLVEGDDPFPNGYVGAEDQSEDTEVAPRPERTARRRRVRKSAD